MNALQRALSGITCSVFLALGLGACGFGVSVGPAFDPALTNPSADFESVKDDGTALASKPYFDEYVLKAVKQIYTKYKLLGYDIHSLYTHELAYGADTLVGTPGPKTMCVAAQVEVMITAMEIYAKETGDTSVFKFLPAQSWKGLTIDDIKGHIWVNSKFDAYGTADALVHFGMGELVPFEKLRAGAFVNFNRTSGNGHAVTFLAFIDKDGKEYKTYNADIIGFKYFSAQGMHDVGGGGFDYRFAVFSKFGCPTTIAGRRDCDIVYSDNRKTFNAGRMWSPRAWSHKPRLFGVGERSESVFDGDHFNGVTTDD